MNRITPGQLVNDLIPRVAICRALQVAPSTVWRWGQRVPKGTGGLIPSRYHAPLLALAQERGLTLTADDLVLGRHNAGECGYNRTTPTAA